MFYSRLISALIDECVAASLGGYDAEDVIGHLSTEGDLIRKTLIKAVCDPRFKSTIRPVHNWEDAAQDKLEELAQKLMETKPLTPEAAEKMADDFLTSYFFTTYQKTSSPDLYELPGRSGGSSGNRKGSGDQDGTGEGDERDEGEEDEDGTGGKEKDDAEKAKSIGSALDGMRFVPGVDDREESGMGDGSGEGSAMGRDEEHRIEMDFLKRIPSSLVRLARLIGRSSTDTGKSGGRFLTATRSDIAGITIGDDLGSMLPSEVAMLSEPGTQDVFMRNFVEKRLQVFASASSGESRPVTRQDGPVIICLDTSSSMSGRPAQIAAALTMAVSIIAQKRHRKVLVIKYAENHHLLTLKNIRRQRHELVDFLAMFCNGGNNENDMFSWLFGTVLPGEKSFTTADVLCVSDFGWMPVAEKTTTTIGEYKKRGMKFYGLDVTGEGLKNFRLPEYISEEGALPPEIIDSMWLWDERMGKCTEEQFRETQGNGNTIQR